ncbi:MAG: hypothetical protein PHC40_03675 [Eubacteriales bacterium]|nr:hypothetical protein [Eubacteriales bacterium]
MEVLKEKSNTKGFGIGLQRTSEELLNFEQNLILGRPGEGKGFVAGADTIQELLYGNPRKGMLGGFKGSVSNYFLATLGPGRGILVRKGFRVSLDHIKTNYKTHRIRVIHGAYKSQKKRMYQKLHNFREKAALGKRSLCV